MIRCKATSVAAMTQYFSFPWPRCGNFRWSAADLDAEVGRTNAGFVNAVTKSGTNDWHGEGFYTNRNADFTSPDAFGNPAVNMQHQFGGAVGGHLKKDRTFFFVAAEQNFLNLPFIVQFQPQPAGRNTAGKPAWHCRERKRERTT